MSINLNVPDLTNLKPRITVIGVGGAGGNAINNMIEAKLHGVEFVAANTDAQALAMSSAEHCMQMGIKLTEGLGAGSRPEIGQAAAEEVEEEIRAQLSGSHMVFIAAGMGGGTGTGAAPVIARISREEGILTVGVVTKPFQFEGQRRLRAAEVGIEELQKHVDTLIVIPNQNLFRIANETTTFSDAFKLADRVLHSGVSCITDLIIKEGLINLDFADVKAVMNGMGTAMMGTGQATGERRALQAAEAAIANPLLDDMSLRGAKGLLISIIGGLDLTLYEVDEAATRIREEVDPEANIIVGATFDETLEGDVRVSIVASGVGNDLVVDRGPQGPKTIARDSDSLTGRLTGIVQPKPLRSDEPATEDEPNKLDQNTPREIELEAVPVTEEGDWQKANNVKIEPGPPRLSGTTRQPGEMPAVPPVAQVHDFVPAPPTKIQPMQRRIPTIEDFPVIGQRELRATRKRPPESGVRAQKRKVGFFEKLAAVGRPKPAADSTEMSNSTPATKLPQETDFEVESLRERRMSPPVNKFDREVETVVHSPNDDDASFDGAMQDDKKSEEEIDIPDFFRRTAQ